MQGIRFIIIGKILGRSLIGSLVIAIILYSMASAYIGYTLINIINFYQDIPMTHGNTGIYSIYSGTASTPLTGLLQPNILDNVSKVKGVLNVWGEVTVPAIVKGNLVTIRGAPLNELELLGVHIVKGKPLKPNDYVDAVVGEGLANRLKIRPGDLLLVDPYFSHSWFIVRVIGIIEGPSPYNYEILVNTKLGEAIRGTRGYTVIRIVYDPGQLDRKELGRALGLNNLQSNLFYRQAILLLSKGLVRNIDPSKIQKYYVTRIGIPVEFIFITGIIGDALLSSLMIPLAWVLVGLRRREFNVLLEEGYTLGNIKKSLSIITIPLVTLSILIGSVLAALIPGATIIGYPLNYHIDLHFISIHLIVLLLLYGAGIVTAKI